MKLHEWLVCRIKRLLSSDVELKDPSQTIEGMLYFVDRVVRKPDGTTIYLESGFRLGRATDEEKLAHYGKENFRFEGED